MCELAAEWFKNRKLRDLGDRHSLWAQADQFARAAHESLDVRETCYTIVNEGRRLLGCDRVTIATLKGGRCRVEAVSGQDTLDSRSNVVTLLGNLATKVVKSGEPLWYTGSTEDLPPQIEQAIEEYVDQSYTKSLAVIPLRKPQQSDAAPNATGGVVVEERAHTGQIVGALIIEQIESDIPREILAPRLDLVYEHSARALSNAIDHNSLFLMPVWRTIGKSAWVVQARTLPKTVTIAVALGLLVVAMIAIPYPYRMWAKGALEPKIKQEVFAPMPGDIMQVKVDHGTTVEAGQELLVMRNPDLEMRVKAAEGELKAAQEGLSGYRNQLNTGGAKLTDTDRAQLVFKIQQEQIKVRNQQEIMDRLKARQQELVVRSPIAGRVITWDARRLLQNRPVETGQVLLTVAAADSDYDIKLFMPERRSQKVAANRDAMKAGDATAEPKVEYILMTEPGKTYYGKIAEISDTTEAHEEHGNIVPIRIAPNEKITAGRPGASVSAYVHCGHRPLGWCMLHEAWEWLEANWFF